MAGGITISRRPNSRPSREKAPGPSKARATAATIIPQAINLTSCKGMDGGEIQANAIPRKHIPITAAATGVSNPAADAAPLRIKTTPSNHFSVGELVELAK